MTWKLGSIMTGLGSSFNIKKSDFGKDGKIKEPGEYKLTDTDEHGATDSMNVIIVRVVIKPFPMNIVESINSKKFTCEVLPKGIKPDSYKWLLKGAFPEKAVFLVYKRNGKPKLVYGTSDEKQTIVKRTRWFVKTGNRLMSVDGPRVGYTINC